MLAREMAVLVKKSNAAGYYTVTFDAPALASVMYLYRMTVRSFVDAKKLVLMRE